MREALIVSDVQADFCAGGAFPIGEDENFIPQVNALIAAHACVIFTQEWHPADHISFASNHSGKKPYDSIETHYGQQILWPDHCIAGTKGAALHPQLKTDTACLILRKGMDKNYEAYSAFVDSGGNGTGLAGFLHERGIEKLTLCGLATDFCIADAAFDAIQRGFKARVALAASWAADINGSYDRALGKMRQAGIELGLLA